MARIERHGPDIEFIFRDGSRYISHRRGLPQVASPAPVLVERGQDLSFAE